MNYNRTIKGDTRDNTEGNGVWYKKQYKKEENYKLIQSTTFWVGNNYQIKK